MTTNSNNGVANRAINIYIHDRDADDNGSVTFDHRVIGLDLVIQTSREKLNFNITRLLRFDIILGKSDVHFWKPEAKT